VSKDDDTDSDPDVYLVAEFRRKEPRLEVKWRSRVRPGKQIKRPLGRAWIERDEAAPGGYRRRGGRAPEGWLDIRQAQTRAIDVMREAERSFTEEALEQARRAQEVWTFRRVAGEWLHDLEHVDGARPSTVRDYRALLAEPDTPYKRGSGVSKGRIIKALGDLDVREITPKHVADFLRTLDREKLTARNINKHRQLVSAVFSYAMREDTYGLASNPGVASRKRREEPAAALDYYEPHEVERLAQALADGAHRLPPLPGVGADELLQRASDDARDADLIRVLFYTGCRLGEVLALRWCDFDPEDGMILVRRAISGGQVVDSPKGRRYRYVPLPAACTELLQRQHERPDFTGPDDYVFPGRFGQPLDDSALRKRYRAACRAAGLRPVKLHGLRHAAGSLFARHATAVEVRDRLGHAKLSTTDRYVSAKVTQEMRDRLDAAYAVVEAGDKRLPEIGE
jgi:integrase